MDVSADLVKGLASKRKILPNSVVYYGDQTPLGVPSAVKIDPPADGLLRYNDFKLLLIFSKQVRVSGS
jgi:hypothetical protein